MKTINLNELRDKAHKNAVEKGFWEEERPIASYLMLVICEIAEAVEADRKDKKRDIADVEHFKKLLPKIDATNTFEKYFKAYIKDSKGDEIADVAIRLLDLAGRLAVDLCDVHVDDGHYLSENFALCAYSLVDTIVKSANVGDNRAIESPISEVFSMAGKFNIDLLWHIEQKMKYNESRERKHGKEY